MRSCPTEASKNQEKASCIRRENPYQKVKELKAHAQPVIKPIFMLSWKEDISCGEMDIPPHIMALKKQMGANKPPMIPHIVARMMGDINEDVVFGTEILDAYDFLSVQRVFFVGTHSKRRRK